MDDDVAVQEFGDAPATGSNCHRFASSFLPESPATMRATENSKGEPGRRTGKESIKQSLRKVPSRNAATQMDKNTKLLAHAVWVKEMRSTKQAQKSINEKMMLEQFEQECASSMLMSGHTWDFSGAHRCGLLNYLQRCVAKPTDSKRLIWDLLGALLVLYDMISLPLEVFSPRQTAVQRFIEWCSRIFWSVDLPSQFMPFFLLPDGFLQVALPAIALHYARSWLLLDVVILFSDWIEYLSAVGQGDGTSTAQVLKALRVMRLLRVFKIMEGFKIPFISGTGEKMS
jgi:hypothetical protein